MVTNMSNEEKIYLVCLKTYKKTYRKTYKIIDYI